MAGFLYEVRVEGILKEPWCQWFEGVQVDHAQAQDGRMCTVLSVPGSDVSLVHGVLAQVGNLNLRLLSVERKESIP